jgi:hypothetical protein
VYPSALHVRWTARQDANAGITVAALAVDNEPIVFWDGVDAHQQIDKWRAAVSFPDDGSWGTVSAAPTNGSSGRIVATEVLDPLGVELDSAWMTDAVPWFFVKHGSKQQGAAIVGRYNPFAAATGLPTSNLPSRPAADELVALAIDTQRDRLRHEITQSRAPLLVTLGDEALRTLVGVVDSHNLATERLDRISYGTTGTVKVGGSNVEWLPLAHPGIVRRAGPWRDAHDAWKQSASG